MRKLILILLPVLAIACSGKSGPETPPPGETGWRYSGLNQLALGAYHATFLLRFEGAAAWTYRLDMRADGQAREYLLHLEGLSPAQNPGDVRMVSQGGVNRMLGPGTDNECVQFPADLVLGPVFYTPDDLIGPHKIAAFLTDRGQGTVAGQATTHYSLNQVGVADWETLQIDMWRDPASGAVLRYDLNAEGNDPLYNAGKGVLIGRYTVNAIGSQSIAPVEGCEIDLPLPSTARGLMKLPGLVAFESPETVADLVKFYQGALPPAGWQAVAEPLAGADATVLSYSRGQESLEINIEQRGIGAAVELFLERASP